MKQYMLLCAAVMICFTAFTQTKFILDANNDVSASVETPDGNYIITGGMGSDMPLYKISATGALIWSKIAVMKNTGDGILVQAAIL